MVRPMLRVLAVLAVFGAAGCSYKETSMSPYVWPTPVYGVPWEARAFTLRYSEWWNTEDEIRATIAELCGPGFDTARISPLGRRGSAAHPFNMDVQCGAPPPPTPDFKGQIRPDSHVVSLKPGAALHLFEP